MHTPPPLHLLFFLLLLSSVFSFDLTTDRAALLSLRSAVSGRTLFWNTTHPTPCTWVGVHCQNDRVTILRLPASSLYGVIPSQSLSNLTLLRTLSLRLNHLYGPLPQDLYQLSNIRNLYLQGNAFSGSVPNSLFSIHSLVRLNLAENNFSGSISPTFNNLTRLRTLYLESNHFSGVLPEIDLPNLEQFNISFNELLNGSVPTGIAHYPNTAFLGTLLCGKPLANECDNSNPIVGIEKPATEKRKKLSGGAIAGIVIGSVIGFILLLLVLFILCRKRNGNRTRSVDVAAIRNQESEKSILEAEKEAISNGLSLMSAKSEDRSAIVSTTTTAAAKKLVFFGNDSRMFDLEDLLSASAEVLGKGTCGTTYKAVLEVGTMLVVKRLKDVMISEREFKEKIEVVGAMDYENLLPLKAYCYNREEKLLVYDYMPMGSLSALLHGSKGAGRTPLSWKIRSRIALKAARGVEYLHFQGPNIAHGNIKSSNILLTKSHDPRVSDFGLNHLVGPPSSPTRMAGYRAPEVTDPRKVSQKADVFSFGVLILELLTGKAPAHALLNEEGVDLPRWVQSIVKEEWTSEVFDTELLQYEYVEEEMVQLLQLGIECTAQYPDTRPSISSIVKRIEEICRSSLRDDQEQHDHVSELD